MQIIYHLLYINKMEKQLQGSFKDQKQNFIAQSISLLKNFFNKSEPLEQAKIKDNSVQNKNKSSSREKQEKINNLQAINKNELKKHTKKGKKKVLVLIPLTIPATGKSRLFSNIQQKLSEYEIQILSCDEIRAQKIENVMKKQKTLTKMEAEDKINPSANKKYYKDLGKIMEKVHQNNDNDKFVLILDRNHSQSALERPIDQIKQSVQKFSDLDVKIICVLPKCEQLIKDGVHSYPFSLSYVASCVLRVVGRDEHQTLEGPETQRANVCINYANMFKDFSCSNKQLSKYFDGAIRLPFHKQQQLTQQIKNSLLDLLRHNVPERYDQNPAVQILIQNLKKWKHVDQLGVQVDMEEVKNLFHNLFENFEHLKVDVKNFPCEEHLQKSQ